MEQSLERKFGKMGGRIEITPSTNFEKRISVSYKRAQEIFSISNVAVKTAWLFYRKVKWVSSLLILFGHLDTIQSWKQEFLSIITQVVHVDFEHFREPLKKISSTHDWRTPWRLQLRFVKWRYTCTCTVDVQLALHILSKYYPWIVNSKYCVCRKFSSKFESTISVWISGLLRTSTPSAR